MRDDFTTFRREKFTRSGLVTKNGQAYPVAAAGYVLTFTAKRRRGDQTPVVQKDNAAIGGATLANGGGWTVTINAADTAGFAVTEFLYYDVVLGEPDGTTTVVEYGTWKVLRGS